MIDRGFFSPRVRVLKHLRFFAETCRTLVHKEPLMSESELQQTIWPLSDSDPCMECKRKHKDHSTGSCLQKCVPCTKTYCCGNTEFPWTCECCAQQICNKCRIECEICDRQICPFYCARFCAKEASWRYVCTSCVNRCDVCHYDLPSKCVYRCEWCKLKVCHECVETHNKLPGHQKCNARECVKPQLPERGFCLEHIPPYCTEQTCFKQVCTKSDTYCADHFIEREWKQLLKMLLEHHYYNVQGGSTYTPLC